MRLLLTGLLAAGLLPFQAAAGAAQDEPGTTVEILSDECAGEGHATIQLRLENASDADSTVAIGYHDGQPQSVGRTVAPESSTELILSGVRSYTALEVSIDGATSQLPVTSECWDDPRVGLGGGIDDAEEAAWNAELVSNSPKPDDFFDPENPGSSNFWNSDIAFSETHAFVGSFNGFMIYDITDPEDVRLQTQVVCPGGQGDVSYSDGLLYVSVEQVRGREDCSLGTPEDDGVDFRGIRIFDVSDIDEPVQVATVQSCRGSHTHTLVTDPEVDDTEWIYIQGTQAVRADAAEVDGLDCEVGPLDEDGNASNDPDDFDADTDTDRFKIDIIRVPLDAPQDAALVEEGRLFAVDPDDPDDSSPHGLWPGGDHGPGTQTTRVTDHCHDITAYPAIGIAAGACSGNGLLIDISDPEDPRRLAEVDDPNFAYWHSATLNDAGDTVIFTDEWGGGTGARCRPSDPDTWGANAIYDIERDADGNVSMEFASYFKLPVSQTDEENCVAHNGSLVPIEGRDVFVQAWYQGGLTVIDFTDSANPVEIAYFDRGPFVEDTLTTAGFWSSYWHDGHVYSTEMGRGFDVHRLLPSDFISAEELAAAEAIEYGTNNPQHQQPIPFPDDEEPVATCERVDPVRFSDVVDGPHQAAIECAAGFGVALGSVDGTFRPGNEVRRDQMASFIARLVTVAGVELPADAPQAFGDVVDGPHQVAIDQLAALDVVQGRTGGTRYDPAASVTRAQMASFLVRSIELVVGEELDAPRSPFTDVAGSVHTGNIDVAYDLGIALGRDATTFAPQANVLRGQMASFLARTLGHLDEVGVELTPIGD